MSMVMIRCPLIGCQVFTGIEIHPESVPLIPPINARLTCPRCGQTHIWSILDANLVPGDRPPFESEKVTLPYN
jgi:hypothetical protein